MRWTKQYTSDDASVNILYQVHLKVTNANCSPLPLRNVIDSFKRSRLKICNKFNWIEIFLFCFSFSSLSFFPDNNSNNKRNSNVIHSSKNSNDDNNIRLTTSFHRSFESVYVRQIRRPSNPVLMLGRITKKNETKRRWIW